MFLIFLKIVFDGIGVLPNLMYCYGLVVSSQVNLIKYIALLLILSSILTSATHTSIDSDRQISIAESGVQESAVTLPSSLDIAQSISSPNGRYLAIPFQLEDQRFGTTRHVLLKDTWKMRSISINPNPDGVVSPSIQIKFVANDNFIISWGCGTYCQSAPLFSPEGNLLTKLGMHSVSPNLELAATLSLIAGDNNVHLIDLSTGKKLVSQYVCRRWSACSAKWTSADVELKSCNEDMQPNHLVLQLPGSGQQ